MIRKSKNNHLIELLNRNMQHRQDRMARVVANLGFISGAMPLDRAVLWSMELKELGNEDVWVIEA